MMFDDTLSSDDNTHAHTAQIAELFQNSILLLKRNYARNKTEAEETIFFIRDILLDIT